MVKLADIRDYVAKLGIVKNERCYMGRWTQSTKKASAVIIFAGVDRLASRWEDRRT